MSYEKNDWFFQPLGVSPVIPWAHWNRVYIQLLETDTWRRMFSYYFFFFLKKRRLQRSIYLCEQNLEKRGLRKWPYKRKKNASFIFVCSDSFAVFLLSFFRSISRVEIIHCMFPYLLSNLTVGGLSSLPATVRSSKGWKYKKECKNWPMETSSLACSRRSLVVFLCCPPTIRTPGTS